MAFVSSINTCLPHAPPAGIGHHWPWHRLARANGFFWELKDAFGQERANKAAGATPMRIDLQKVDAEITALRSKLAAINDHIDECRRGYFEHPWAWSQTRRLLTSERHRVQRRLEELTFVCRCAGARPLESAATLPFSSLFDMQSNCLTLRLIQGGRS